jgi:hypothetical protein
MLSEKRVSVSKVLDHCFGTLVIMGSIHMALVAAVKSTSTCKCDILCLLFHAFVVLLARMCRFLDCGLNIIYQFLFFSISFVQVIVFLKC